MHRFRKIVHPTDLREKSRAAFEIACDIAHQNEAELVVLHVTPKGIVSYLNAVSERDEAETQARLWRTLCERRPEEGDIDVMHIVEEGDPATTILRVARETDADLLVIGPSDSTHVPLFWFTASTFDELVHRCPCPLLVAVPKSANEDAGHREASDAAPRSAAALPRVATPPAPLAGMH